MRHLVLRLTALALLAVLLAGAAVWLWPANPLPEGAQADAILVLKSERRLILMKAGKQLKSYPISLGGNPNGHKQREGDERTPEGRYSIDFRKADSSFHKALHISYPGPADTARAQARGDSPGGAIMIHGLRNGFGWIGRLHLAADWTNGCIAVTDPEIEEIWRAVPDGTPIEIRP